mgnify:FL=1|jgi:hypothetical protein
MRYESDFIGAVKARQHEISASLAKGHCVNFETYQRLVGQYQGLEEALDILNNLLKEPNENERAGSFS